MHEAISPIGSAAPAAERDADAALYRKITRRIVPFLF